jgi:hypothetical protein
VHGEKDNAIQAEIGGKLFSTAQSAPIGKFHLLPKVNHKLKDGMCAQITDLMTDFLAELPPQDA